MVKTCIFLLLMIGAEAHGEYLSHPPVRPLPNPSKRPLGRGPAYFVDAKRGNDANPGSKEKPWKTVQHGITRLKLGETLYLRGGIYYENLGCKLNGHPEAPVTVRSYPGELAVLDGGVPEFTDDPAGSWLPVEGGAEGEFVSKKSYPDVTRVAAIFADSMIPLQSYRNLIDLRSDDPFWNLKHKADTQTGMYCGPGVWFNSETNRIHVRLRHYKIPQLKVLRRQPQALCTRRGGDHCHVRRPQIH